MTEKQQSETLRKLEELKKLMGDSDEDSTEDDADISDLDLELESTETKPISKKTSSSKKSPSIKKPKPIKKPEEIVLSKQEYESKLSDLEKDIKQKFNQMNEEIQHAKLENETLTKKLKHILASEELIEVHFPASNSDQSSIALIPTKNLRDLIITLDSLNFKDKELTDLYKLLIKENECQNSLISPNDLKNKLYKLYDLPAKITEEQMKKMDIPHPDHKEFLVRYLRNRKDFDLFYAVQKLECSMGIDPLTLETIKKYIRNKIFVGASQ